MALAKLCTQIANFVSALVIRRSEKLPFALLLVIRRFEKSSVASLLVIRRSEKLPNALLLVIRRFEKSSVAVLLVIRRSEKLPGQKPCKMQDIPYIAVWVDVPCASLSKSHFPVLQECEAEKTLLPK